MLFAVSLPYSPLERGQKKSVLDYVTKELLTIRGIRSLTPKSNQFHPYYAGSENEKNLPISTEWLSHGYWGPILKHT